MTILIVYLAIMLALMFVVLVAYGADKVLEENVNQWLFIILFWPIVVSMLISVEIGFRLKKAGIIK